MQERPAPSPSPSPPLRPPRGTGSLWVCPAVDSRRGRGSERGTLARLGSSPERSIADLLTIGAHFPPCGTSTAPEGLHDGADPAARYGQNLHDRAESAPQVTPAARQRPRRALLALLVSRRRRQFADVIVPQTKHDTRPLPPAPSPLPPPSRAHAPVDSAPWHCCRAALEVGSRERGLGTFRNMGPAQAATAAVLPLRLRECSPFPMPFTTSALSVWETGAYR